MSVISVDFAVFGATPLSFLIAGLLAQAHAKTVCLLGELNSAYRVARGFDLSVTPQTRPESWSLLRETTPETLKLLNRLRAQSATERLDPVFIAQTANGRAALSHIRHMALGYGYDAETMRDDSLLAPSAAVRMRDAVLLLRPQLEPLLETWVVRSGVYRRSPKRARLSINGEDGAVITIGIDIVEARRVILADDAAVLSHLDSALREPHLKAVTTTSLLTEPAASLHAPFVTVIDRDIVYRQGRTRAITALALGPTDRALMRIGSHLAGNGALRRAGQSVFKTLVSRDGGPVLGVPPGADVTILTGLGLSGAFLAPAIARWLAGTATPAEGSYFEARAPAPLGMRGAVCDLTAMAADAQVAGAPK